MITVSETNLQKNFTKCALFMANDLWLCSICIAWARCNCAKNCVLLKLEWIIWCCLVAVLCCTSGGQGRGCTVPWDSCVNLFAHHRYGKMIDWIVLLATAHLKRFSHCTKKSLASTILTRSLHLVSWGHLLSIFHFSFKDQSWGGAHPHFAAHCTKSASAAAA